jgi:(p)ppGpp synthase/HD superfamily hydrolase
MWVGTAPSNMYKSMSATTYGESKKAEFQIRSLGSDGR